MRRAALSLAVVALLAACHGASTPTTVAAPGSPTASTSASPQPLTSPSARTGSGLPKGLVDLSGVDQTIMLDMRYATAHNFVGRVISGYFAPRCVLSKQAAQALHRAQNAARTKGYSLKMYDCYRPLRAGRDFQQWAKRPAQNAMKAEFFPSLAKSAVFAEGYVSNGRSAHSRGSTVDLTLVALPAHPQRPYVPGEPLMPCTAPHRQRFPDNGIDMGTGYDCFDSRSHTLDRRLTGTPRSNRLLLRQLMTDAGFRNAAHEWWHYTLRNEPHPTTYFDFPIV